MAAPTEGATAFVKGEAEVNLVDDQHSGNEQQVRHLFVPEVFPFQLKFGIVRTSGSNECGTHDFRESRD